MGMGVRGGGVGVGVGTGGAGGAPGDASDAGARPFAFGFFPVVCFGVVLRGAGVLFGCAIELPSLLKKSPMGLPATAHGLLARSKLIVKIKTTLPDSRPIGPAIVHDAAQCSIFPRAVEEIARR
jgi:hypothetical protein